MLGEAIKHYRNMHKMTQQELAKIISCSVDSVRRWESNTREPRASEIQKLCETFRCTESELLNGPDDGKTKIIISYDWEDYEKGEVDMDKKLFKFIVGDNGQIGIIGATLPCSEEEFNNVSKQLFEDFRTIFDFQVKRGAIQLAEA